MPDSHSARLVRIWNGLWSGMVPPHLYAVLRVAYGALGLLGLVGVADSAFWRSSLLVAPQGTLHELAHRTGDPDTAGGAVFWFSALSYALMTVGLWTRTSTVCAYASSLLHAQWNLLPLSSAFLAHRVGLFCLMFADCGRVWSVDAWWRVREAARQPVWPLRLLRFQVALIYFWSGISKLLNASWRDGSALHYVIANEQFRRLAWTPPGSFEPPLAVLTYLTLAWELAFPFLLLHRRGRRFALASGVALHSGMAVILELGPFSLVMLASYLAFLDPVRVAARFAGLSRVTAPRVPSSHPL